MERERRVWLLPVILAGIVLSVPIQMAFEGYVSEPYPGLFQPAFGGVGQRDDRVVRLTVVEIEIDGRHVQPFDLFPTDGNARGILESMFPPSGDDERIDEATRRTIRAAVLRRFDGEPNDFSVTWERRRFHLDSGKLTEGRSLARYNLDLGEEVR